MPVRVFQRVRIPVIDVELPDVELPDFPPKPVELTRREVELLRYGLMEDLADVVPVVGDVLADIAHKEILDRLEPGEHGEFLEANKWLPTTLALLKVFYEKRVKKGS